jgi:4-methyl-5(b-hydroxyethyl)-thiazole monophosphate biosynthesis
MSGKVLVLLAEGFEEIEAMAPVDVFRRIDVETITAGISGKQVTGAHNIKVEADIRLENAELSEFSLVMLPGGMPGSRNLMESPVAIKAVQEIYNSGGFAAAICAAPIALGKAGILKGKKATCYPGFENMLEGAEYTAARVEKDGRVITAKGPGTAYEFTKALAEALGKTPEITETFEAMFVNIQ